MKPNGRRAWRAAAKKLRRELGRRWRSPEPEWSGKRWSELVPDLEAHRAHVAGAWFRRHGFQSFDSESSSRHYIGLWGTVDGETIGFVEVASALTARTLVGMSQSSRKRKARAVAFVVINSVTLCEHAVPLASSRHERLFRERGFPRHSDDMMCCRDVRAKYRIGDCLRPCHGCEECRGYDGDIGVIHCDGSGVLPARKAKR